jgi:hypothetical protein
MECAHPGCHCEPTIERSGRRYCSEECFTAASNGETECTCGHASCERIAEVANSDELA